MKIIVFLLFLGSFTVFAQRSSSIFFSAFTLAEDDDTLTTDELQAIVKKHKSTFNQPLFTYGSDDPKEWELVSDYVLKYADVALPIAHLVDVNKDEFDDLIVSMTRGDEYTAVGIYLGTKKGYRNIFFERAMFYGTFSNGDILLRAPACCDDPTTEFLKIHSSINGTITKVDSLSIASFIGLDNLTQENIFNNRDWYKSATQLNVRRLDNQHEIYGSFKPGAQVRIIEEREVDNLKFMFCEIMGELEGGGDDNQLFPHAFVWLSAE